MAASSELSVLVIEDDSQFLRTLGDILGRRGYRALIAQSALSAGPLSSVVPRPE